MQILEDTGYRVIDNVCSGELALKTLEISRKPDLILMDIGLAGLPDGIETAGLIRRRFSIPLIFVTAYSSDLNLERIREVAPEGIITKPSRDKEILALVGTILGN
jgi:CheY-like chemotaxis protein